MTFYDNLDVLDYIYNKLNTSKTALGIQFVGYADEEFMARYPAISITSGDITRNEHSMQYFRNDIGLDIFVLHADLTETHAARTRADMLLARSVVQLLHKDYKLGGNIIFGYVASESPGVVMDADRGVAVVATRLAWTGQTREPMTKGG